MIESLRLSKYPDDWNATHRYQVQSWNFLIINICYKSCLIKKSLNSI